MHSQLSMGPSNMRDQQAQCRGQAGGAADLAQGIIGEGHGVGDVEGGERGEAGERGAQPDVADLLAVAQRQRLQPRRAEDQRHEGAALQAWQDRRPSQQAQKALCWIQLRRACKPHMLACCMASNSHTSEGLQAAVHTS